MACVSLTWATASRQPLPRGGLVLDPMGPKEVRAELLRVVGTYDALLKFLNAARA